MGSSFSWAQHARHRNIIVITTPLGGATAPGDDVQKDIVEFNGWVASTFQGKPFSLLTVMRNTDLVLGESEEEMLAQSTVGMAQMFKVARAGYVLDSATMRLQFARVFRQHGLGDRFRAFEHEHEALAFLVAPAVTR